jgi:hypothetical protein
MAAVKLATALRAVAVFCIVAVDAARPQVVNPPRACGDTYVHRLASAVERATGRAVHVPPSLMPCADPDRRRTVTFSVPPDKIVGGFGDRLLGMVTAFYAALATDAVFGVDWASPYPLSAFFYVPCASNAQPGAVIVDAIDVWTHFTEHEYRANGHDVVYRTNARHWATVVNASAAKGMVGALHLHDMDERTLFRVAVDALLGAPTPKLALAAARALPAGAPVVGVQIRVGGRQPKFADSAARHQPASAACFGAEAHRACRSLRPGPCTLFLTTDSLAAAAAFKRAYGHACGRDCARVVEVEGDVLHTDRTTAADVAGLAAADVDRLWTKSVVDWFLLKRADALVISRSGFGETAAWAGGGARAGGEARVVRQLVLQEAAPGACAFRGLAAGPSS